MDKRDSTSPKKLDDLKSEFVVSDTDSDSEKEEWLSQDPGDILDLKFHTNIKKRNDQNMY